MSWCQNCVSQNDPTKKPVVNNVGFWKLFLRHVASYESSSASLCKIKRTQTWRLETTYVCVCVCLRVEFLLKTDSGYPNEKVVTLLTLVNPENPPFAIKPLRELYHLIDWFNSTPEKLRHNGANWILLRMISAAKKGSANYRQRDRRRDRDGGWYSQGFYFPPRAGGEVRIFGFYNNKQTNKRRANSFEKTESLTQRCVCVGVNSTVTKHWEEFVGKDTSERGRHQLTRSEWILAY